MAVEVRIPTVLRKFTAGESAVEVAPGTVRDVIDQLNQRFPGLKGQMLNPDGGLHRFVNVYVNDEDVRYLDALDTKVDEGETVSVLPSVAGG